MLLAVELILTLLVGFVLGRVWQIRQQIQFAERVRQRSFKISVADKKRPPATASNPGNKARPTSPASAMRLSIPNAA
jgi:hypothetical protein